MNDVLKRDDKGRFTSLFSLEERKQRDKDYRREYYQKNKEKLDHNNRIHQQQENYKEKKKEWNKEYVKKPKVIEKIKQWRLKNRERNRLYNKEYRERNRDKIQKQQQQYQIENRDHISKISREWREKNKEWKSGNDRKYYEKNYDRIKENGIKYRLKNKEIIKIKKKEYREKNKEEISEKNKLKWRLKGSPLIFELISFRKFWSAIEAHQNKRKFQDSLQYKTRKKILDKIWREKNKEKINLQRKEYYKEYSNRFETKERQKQYRLENRVLLQKQKKEDYQKNKEHYLELGKIQYRKNPDKVKRQAKKWVKENPERRLEIMHRHLKRLGIPFKMDQFEYGYALHSWSQVVKKIYGETCVICNQVPTQVHHILHKAKHPKLSLNPNNGIPLCVIHHKEVHGYNMKT